ncbi:choline dehydrogenase [Rubrivivax gelatinosus]|uniref:GMC family oxidoreductase n=3 Tax=Rubrivivax gelatinosus TaxID=28068 RepID=UPI0018CB1BA5|nr:GMC family oxidoreductase N-terminal domain-containing protein [Rubrivivax gelatinosus]MBG6082405.1 choline dehydrogenase [Rubrivivax gelatinosus]
MSVETWDYIVVGAGSAGCALAARLSEDPAVRVLLLEAGPRDRSPWIHLPIGYGKTMWSERLNWRFHTEPQREMDGRRLYWPRGRTLGGSSSINGLIYIRGQREDYDGWAALGNPGWGWDEVLPYFVRSECNVRGASALHGDAGPLRVSDIGAAHPLVESFIDGARALGLPRNDDFNGPSQEGAGYYQLTTWRGWRWSAARAYLQPARRRHNLRVLTEAQATGLVFEGRRVVGVRWRRGERTHEARATAEVLLCAGAVQSPQLLQVSGVGDPEHLQSIGVPLRHALPGVGRNLQDHLQLRLIYECTRPITTNDQLRSWRGRAAIALQWALHRSGPLAVGINQGGAFMRALPESTRPDTQFHVATLSADMAGGKAHPFSGFTVSVCQLRPASRGWVLAASPDALQAPRIQPRYLSAPEDRRAAVAALHAARAIVATPPMRALVHHEHKPGLAAHEGDDSLLAFARREGATIFHPVGTCRMGADEAAVVDAALRVRGLQGLRVVDASVMPTLVSGNTHAAAVMIAEKAADLIRHERRRTAAAAGYRSSDFAVDAAGAAS